ncbi:MAG: hypothetical protein COS71_02520 [Candidatus Moranbacteria bacterium CG06_land_8_20_14_3_00_40_12]|nr:MAG: hypothetical protein COX31_00495 [Candidatus Moranbacteria bacterium CG23_combo_of_CG06-09_8_20_14_all_40_16]PIU80605.1 MAG: hypothetical protein COS71_02520 [Candidatus Moranbacteria bacterium CG06_land_8_20_14_3_00_40_12]
MRLDLTPRIILDKSQRQTYFWLRVLLYLLAFAVFFYLAFRLAFPIRTFSFSFLNPNSSKNTITDLHDFRGDFINLGNFKAGEDNYFFVSWAGPFSQAAAEFSLNKRSDLADLGTINIRKGYKAFFYPEGEAPGFKEGSLLKSNSRYFIISENKLHEFENLKLVESLGFNPQNFWTVLPEELSVNISGAKITAAESYPDGTLFKILDNFYLKKDSELQKFSSQAAFLSHYPLSWAIEKDDNFLKANVAGEEVIGFADGSLIAYGDAVSIVSGKNIYPIDNFTTFEALGYSWDDLIPAGGDEVSLYEKQKLINLSSPHPSGTIFYATDIDKYYMIHDGQKKLLKAKVIADSWLKKSPILVEEKNLKTQGQCVLSQKSWLFKTYLCQADISSLQNLKGKDYEFKFQSQQNFRANNLTVSLRKDYSFANLNKNLREIFASIKKNYVSQDNAQ